MPLLFSYGSLQQDDVQLATYGRLLEGSADELLRFERSEVRIDDPEVAARLGRTHHANVVFSGNEASRVAGMVFGVSDTELAATDAYEEAYHYSRTVTTLASGRDAWVYLHSTGS